MSTFTRPNILSLLTFEAADMFGPECSESIAHTDAEGALDEMLENSDLAFGGDVLKLLDREVIVMAVCAYKRIPIEDFYRKAWTEGLVESLRENFGEEHGDLDGEDGLNDADVNELHARMKSTVDWYLALAKSYPCEVVHTWHFDNADLRELIEQLKPEWLEKTR